MARKKNTESKPRNRVYFTKDTERAIIAFNECNNLEDREIIFKNSLEYPLNKLAENVINRFKFPYMNASFEDLKSEVVSNLMINLHKYTQNKGKAFSYFSVIAKNYLILHNTKGYKQAKRSITLSETGDGYVPIEEMITLEAPDAYVHEEITEFVSLFVAFWDANLLRYFKKPRDVAVASALLTLFRRANGIENFNKKALYLLIREMTDCKTSHITRIVNKFREYIIIQMQQYQSEGVVTHPIAHTSDYK